MQKTSFLFLLFMLPTLLFATNTKCTEKSYLSFGDDANHSIDFLQKTIKTNPQDVKCMVKLVNLYLKRGYVSKGFALLVEAYKINPNFIKNQKIYKIIHVAQYMTKLKEKAKQKNDIHSWNLLGFGYYKMGVFKEAIKAYRKSLDINSTQIGPKLNMAIALSRIGQKYRALEELMDVISQDKNNFFAYYYAGKILKYQIGDKDKAEIYLKKAKKLCKIEKNAFSRKMYKLYLKDLNEETEK
jgi:tetratricopeptide (TPR) repeat protein